MDRATLAAFNRAAHYIVEAGTIPPDVHARLARSITAILAAHRVLMPWRVVQSCKRLGLPHQNPVFVDDVLAHLCGRGNGEAISAMVQALRYKGWVMPGRWDEQHDLFTDHGFTVAPHPTRQYCYVVQV